MKRYTVRKDYGIKYLMSQKVYSSDFFEENIPVFMHVSNEGVRGSGGRLPFIL